ncbi:TadE/TadG family type IV pilus assembly protein [Bifidobacterium scaligerum]|uniref:Pilus assembly protein TadE n=1 Tax=Bifidobacterium scaligerum TaxID=2052656 RepID=A0A2M9HNS5_9BIFI|nr:TadE/TadG family type IV pilus assembly protein [Bifidobacterium scaligerum]PJM78421.1 pilus assembly protein TadE [Bifidobacterium scaligerum]
MTYRCFRQWSARLPPGFEQGSATAEFALVLPSVVAIAGLILALCRVVVVSMDCQSAAAAAARALVVSDALSDSGAGSGGGTGTHGDAAAVASHVAGAEVSLNVEWGSRSVRVIAECPVLPGPLGLTPVKVSGDATAMKQ